MLGSAKGGGVVGGCERVVFLRVFGFVASGDELVMVCHVADGAIEDGGHLCGLLAYIPTKSVCNST